MRKSHFYILSGSSTQYKTVSSDEKIIEFIIVAEHSTDMKNDSLWFKAVSMLWKKWNKTKRKRLGTIDASQRWSRAPLIRMQRKRHYRQSVTNALIVLPLSRYPFLKGPCGNKSIKKLIKKTTGVLYFVDATSFLISSPSAFYFFVKASFLWSHFHASLWKTMEIVELFSRNYRVFLGFEFPFELIQWNRSIVVATETLAIIGREMPTGDITGRV